MKISGESLVFRLTPMEITGHPSRTKKKGESDPSDQVPDKEPTKDVPADELSSRIERLVLEESSHTPSRPTSAHADSSESLPIADHDLTSLFCLLIT